MKKFTCREIGGPCDEVFEGETAMDIARQNGAHWMGTTDEAHKPMRDMMTKNPSEENRKKWWDWFNKEWDKKEET